MRLFFTFFLLALLANAGAQNAPNYFKTVATDAIVLPENARREFEPLRYSAFTLDYDALIAQVQTAPREFTPEVAQNPCILMLPLADGRMEPFSVIKVGVMAPALEAQHPEIITLGGASLQTPGMRLRITISPYWGMRAMILHADKDIEYVQPVALGQNRYYMAYRAGDEPADPAMGALTTGLDRPYDFNKLEDRGNSRFTPGGPQPEDGAELDGLVKLKKYKFACACTGEFSQDNGGTKEAVFAKVTTTTNQLNAIYERDINIRLELIPESYDIIFLDPATDPYPGTTVFEWMNANPSAMFSVLGATDKYDIGHVFARYITGDAIGVAGGYCCMQDKGRGCSAGTGNYGNSFFSTVGQEIGHMWGGWHTWNKCADLSEPFPSIDRCEPGSGNTIMSYHGSCGSDNTGGQAALYYHTCSIATIRAFVENGDGNTCGTEEVTNNNDPIATAAHPSSFFIPISTPFELTGSAVDPDGDTPLTYCWDEIDLGPMAPLGSPVGDSPAFIWMTPTNNPTRTFPRIQTIIANATTKTEVLPTYNRDLTFVFVARDNKPGGGGIGYDTVAMRSTTTAGPFLVTYPNDQANTVWRVDEYQTVTWDVANTNNTLVNCQNVNIRLSTDGGLTYPIMLAQNVPNIGKACVTVPNNAGTTARIRVEAADNVFFDISNTNFSIQAPSTPTFALCAANLKSLTCLPAPFSTVISTTALAGFSTPVTLSATGLPNGATATFSPNPVAPGAVSTVTITFPTDAVEGVYDVNIIGTAGAASSTSTITLTTVRNDFTAVAPTAPANGASGVSTTPLLQWTTTADANAYEVQLATNPSFAPNTIVASNLNATTGSFQIGTPLNEGAVYYWRVRAKNECGGGQWSAPQVFVISLLNCAQLAANDLPKTITPNGTPTVESKINLVSGGTISDVNVTRVQGFHEYFSDLDVRLYSPAGTEVVLWKDRCGSYNGSFSIAFDDGAGATFSCPPPTGNTSSKPAGLLANYNNQNSTGQWTLRIKDNDIGSGGTLSAFELQICSNEATNPPFITVNNVLVPVAGTNLAITEGWLKSEDSNNSAEQLVYTLLSIPQHGTVAYDWTDMQVGSQFTQADINNGLIRYFDWGWGQGDDSFDFVVADNEGGIDMGTFVVSPNVSVKEAYRTLGFDLSPNPAKETLRISLSESLTEDAVVHLFNAAGQRVGAWVMAQGQNNLQLAVNHLPPGIYAVSIAGDAVRGVKKVVIR
ncbi:MAG: zinc-dependent metalloprotease family protein [Saprospiraceae bacterium]|nr:zinc-dependent metalloprotease family protein [Saprospiraceae bacterium]